MPMNIYAKNGDKVVFSNPNNGYDGDRADGRKYLTVGKVYTVDHTEVDSSHTNVWLKEIPTMWFNSVLFNDAEPEPMNPKTQSVCPESLTKQHQFIEDECSYCGAPKPVAEPASTGEPPCECGERNCICRYLDRAARPSEPSAPRKSAIEIASERDLKVITEPIDWEAVENDAAPQTSAEPKKPFSCPIEIQCDHAERCLDKCQEGFVGFSMSPAAAPSVVGTQPTPEERELLLAQFFPQGTPQAQGMPEPPKVEELAWKVVQYFRDLHSVTYDQMQADIATILRPYFPPASQTHSGPLFAPKPNCPDCRGEGWKDRKDEEYCDPCPCLQVAILSGERIALMLPAQLQSYLSGDAGDSNPSLAPPKTADSQIDSNTVTARKICEALANTKSNNGWMKIVMNILATPASTARTDATKFPLKWQEDAFVLLAGLRHSVSWELAPEIVKEITRLVEEAMKVYDAAPGSVPEPPK